MTDENEQRDRNEQQRDNEQRDSLARARSFAENNAVSRCHAVTHRDVTRDSDIAPASLRNVTITPAPTEADRRKDEHRQRMAADPRFAAWASRAPR